VTVEADIKPVEPALPGFKSREEIRREKVREKGRKYYAANPEKVRERDRKYRAANREKVREYKRNYFAANREKKRERDRKYRAANLEKHREAQRKWYATNPEKSLEYKRKRRYGLTNAEYNEFLVRQNHVCALCKQPEKAKQNGRIKALAVDHCHETAEKYGAEHSIRGLLCFQCNKTLARAMADRKWWKRVVQYLSGFENARDDRLGAIKLCQ
jgi:hypothetical protein